MARMPSTPREWKEAGVFGDEVVAVAVMGGEEEVSFLHEDVGGAGEDLRVVALAEFGEQDADGLGVGAVEGAGDQAGLVAELLGGGLDAFARGRGMERPGALLRTKETVAGLEVEVLGQHLEADAARGCWDRRLLTGIVSNQSSRRGFGKLLLRFGTVFVFFLCFRRYRSRPDLWVGGIGRREE